MREISDGLGNNPGIGLLAVVAYWVTLLVDHVNVIISMFSGLGACVLLTLTIIGKWHEVQERMEKRKAKKADKGGAGDSVSDIDSDK